MATPEELENVTAIVRAPGRPSTFTPELAAAICAELAMGRSLRSVCADEEMPSVSTVFNWFSKHPSFVEQYARAKQESADAMAEEILDIADDSTNDYMEREGKDGESYEVVNHENIQRSKLRVDTRKFLMAKMKPKVYGDKLDVTSGGNPLTSAAAVLFDEPEEDEKEEESPAG